MQQNKLIYEEKLTTIANTRLVYNTMSELEEFLDNHSIHSNGIRRSFTSEQKLRSAFRDIKLEVSSQTKGAINLKTLLSDYKRTWAFFYKNFYRRKNTDKIAIEILKYFYAPIVESINDKKELIYQEIIKQDINIPLLILMIMKAIPGYDSKNGDIPDFHLDYDRIINFIEYFVSDSPNFDFSPTIKIARVEQNKTRLKLIYHIQNILYTYQSYIYNEYMYDMTNDIKSKRVDLDIAGFWNEHPKGELLYTDFWQIENTSDYGTYFLTKWMKRTDNNTIEGIRYTLFIMQIEDGKFIHYMLHPKAIKNKIDYKVYTDEDQVWYESPELTRNTNKITLKKLIYSSFWRQNINLTRCTDKNAIATYEKWLSDYEIVKPFANYEYQFYPNIYAITRTNIYIPYNKSGKYYKIPKSAYEGFERIQISDNIGTLIMGGKTFLAFDEFMLYIDTNPETLAEYGIEIVDSIQ